MNNINVVYTPWANLKKTADMDVGQIGFHRQKEVWGEINSDFAQTAANSGPDLLFACMSLFLFNWNYRKQTSLSQLCQKKLHLLPVWAKSMWFKVLTTAYRNLLNSFCIKYPITIQCQQVKIVAVEKKINEVINRLEKTREERYPDLAVEKESRDREERNEKKALLQEQKKKEKDETRKKKEMDELKYIITSTQTIIYLFLILKNTLASKCLRIIWE